MKAALQLAIEQAFQQAEHAMQQRRNTEAFQWLERARMRVVAYYRERCVRRRMLAP